MTATDPLQPVTKSIRIALKSLPREALIALLTVLLNSSISMADTNSVFTVPLSTERFQSVLEREYPDYSLFDWPSEMRGYRESPEHFVGDFLFGDFNFDGVLDFSVMLSRGLSEDELAEIPERYREDVRRLGLTVVCNGTNDVSSTTEFSCTTLTDEELGGNIKWLDLTDLSIWRDDLEEQSEAYNNPDCPSQLRSPTGEKFLSLVQPVGHCDAYFYPIDNEGYGRCEYCAD